MRVLVTGATGFIGRALIPLLQRDGHSVVAWVRSETGARSLLGAEVELVPADAGLDGLVSAVERCHAVVNLAGEPLMGGRWTAARRAILEDSRVTVTDLLVRAMAAARTRPSVFISGSAVGYYGDRAEESSRKRRLAATAFSRGSAAGGRARPAPPKRWACVWCGCEPGLSWVGPGAHWRTCFRRLNSDWVGQSDPGNNTCRGFISTIS